MSDLQKAKKAIDKLRSSPHYKELADYEPPFNPFDIVGATHRERTHSSVLAWLLRDEENKEFRQRFIDKIAIKLKLDLSVLNDLTDFKPKEVKTEYSFKAGVDFDAGSIDVFAHFESLDLVIGIEVKVNAGERPEQVKKYQKLFCQKYPDPYNKVIVFLTPGGYLSKTKGSVSGVHVLEMSWSNIAWMIREMRTDRGNKNDFRMQFLQHLERNIAKNKIEEQRIVHALLSEGDNLENIKEITSNMPSHGSLYDKEVIKEIVGEDNAEMVQKIINNRTSLQISLECEFWKELKEQLEGKNSGFQLYYDELRVEAIEDGELKGYIRWGDGGSLGLTFRIPDSSLDDGYEVVCRITYDPNSYVYYGFVLCKEDNIEHRVEIDKNHEEYLNLYRDLLEKKIFNHGPEEKNGWLGWKLRADVNIYFANGPALFDTLVDIKERKDEDKENIVKKLAEEICGVTKEISEKTKQWKNRPS